MSQTFGKQHNKNDDIEQEPGDDESNNTLTTLAAPVKLYHERQSKQLCALHALNNLFQDPRAFSKQDLDSICDQLAPDASIFNPHRSVLGLGCYDVNVIIAALAKKGFDVIWFDKRKDPNILNLENIYGFILNVPNTPSDGLLSASLNYILAQTQIWSSQKHWIALKKVGSHYYHLDSKLVAPVCIGNESSLLQHLKHNSEIEQAEILIVVQKSVSEGRSYLKEEKKNKNG